MKIVSFVSCGLLILLFTCVTMSRINAAEEKHRAQHREMMMRLIETPSTAKE